jgi:N-acetylmuramoyl-L-alanine amidase-like protein
MRRRFPRAVRTTIAMAGAAVGFTIWLVAPALSLDPYVPDPVDFELRDRPPQAQRAQLEARSARGGAAPAVVLHSRVLRAPKRFNLVGLRWKGADSARLRVRVRRGGGRWSRWVTVPVDPDHGPDAGSSEGAGRRGWTTSDPLWAGEADQVQYRLGAPRSVRDVRLHFVNSTGTATTLDRLRSGLRRAVSAAVTEVGSLFPADAHAQDGSQPEIVTREQWGADACPPRATPAYGEVKVAFVHHTVTASDYAPEQSAAMVLGVCRYHRNSNGWNDIGYQFVVDKYGKIFEGRAGGMDRAVVGAQAQGYNSQTTGISNLGTFSTTGQTEEGLAALARLLTWKLALHGVPPTGKVTIRSGGGSLNRYPAGAEVTFDAISGHRDADRTACPGDALYSQLPRLRGMVTADARATAKLSLTPERRNIPYGRKALLSGQLAGADGSPLSGTQVLIQALGTGQGVRTLASAATGATGSFAVNLKLVFNRTLQGQFGGDGGFRPALSVPFSIGVRPRLTAALGAAVGRHLRLGQKLVLNGSVRPRKRIALLLIDRRRTDGAYARVVKKPVPVRLGQIRADHRFKKAGRYRLRLGVDRDFRNLSARSAPIEIGVG